MLFAMMTVDNHELNPDDVLSLCQGLVLLSTATKMKSKALSSGENS